MNYVALLRGINVGGNRKVEMARLKDTFSRVGCKEVSTYINSGNILFEDHRKPSSLTRLLQKAIAEDFGFEVPVLIRDIDEIRLVVAAVPDKWVNDSTERTDVWFLWDEFDAPDVLDQFTMKPDIDEAMYIAGAVVWRADGKALTRSGRALVTKIPLYKGITIRNINTVRKIHALMEERSG